VTEPLIAALKDADQRVRDCVVCALGTIKDPRAVNALLALTKAMIAQGKSGSEAVLIEAFSELGNKDMAEAFLNCGNPKLKAAANAWATKHGVQIIQSDRRGQIRWGSGR
jgi:HEAT repeat protein